MTVENRIVVDQFGKQSWESYIIGVDHSKNLASGEYIVLGSSTIIAADADGEDVTDTVLDNDAMAVGTASQSDIDVTPVTNGLLSTRIRSGTSGVIYTITFKAVTSENNKFETDIKMKVED